MRKLYYLFIFLFLFGCEDRSRPERQQEVSPVKLVSRLEKKVGRELQAKYGLVPVGTGGQMMNQVKKLMLIFNYPLPLSEEEGRELVINAVDYYLNAINQHEQLRPFLENDPFTHKNVEIAIFLQDHRGVCIQPYKFVVIKSMDGFIVWKADDPKTDRLHTIFKEPFEEAKLKVANSRQR